MKSVQTSARAQWFLEDPQGQVIWQRQTRLEGEKFHQSMRRDLLTPGETYVLKIYGRKGGQDHLLTTQKLRLTDGR